MKVAIAELKILEDQDGPINPAARTRRTTDLQKSMQDRLTQDLDPLIEPIVVAPPNGDGRYRLLSGHRRVTAARALGIKELSAVVDAGDDLLVTMTAANMHRDLSPMEQVWMMRKLSHAGHTPQQIRAAFGWDVQGLQLRIDLAQADSKVQRLVDTGKMSWSAFRAICKESSERQEIIVEKAEERGRAERVTVDAVRSAKKEVQDEENGERVAGDTLTLNERLNEIRSSIQAVTRLAPFSPGEQATAGFLIGKIQGDLNELKEAL